MPAALGGPDALRRRLWQLSRTMSRPDWDARQMRVTRGIVEDDATVVVARRRAREGG